MQSRAPLTQCCGNDRTGTSRAVLALVLAAGVAACTPVSGIATTANPRVGEGPVPSSRALALFDEVCGASLPDFRSAERRLAANGFTDRATSGTIFSPAENASFRVADSVTFGPTCSFVFASQEPPDQVFETFAALGTPTPSALGVTGLYRDREAIVLYSPPTQRGPLVYYNLRLTAEQ